MFAKRVLPSLLAILGLTSSIGSSNEKVNDWKLETLISNLIKNGSFIGDPVVSSKCPVGFKTNETQIRTIQPIRIGIGCESVNTGAAWEELTFISNNGRLIDSILITSKISKLCSKSSLLDLLRASSNVKFKDGELNLSMNLESNDYDVVGVCTKETNDANIGIHAAASRLIISNGDYCKALDQFGIAKSKGGCNLFGDLTTNAATLVRTLRNKGFSQSEIKKNVERFWDSEVGKFKDQIDKKKNSLTNRNQDLVNEIIDKNSYILLLSRIK